MQPTEQQLQDRIRHLELENSELQAKVEGVANANANAVELMIELEETRQALEARNAQITEQKDTLSVALEKAEAAARAKSVFLANMSHEVRTPLTAILGFTDMLLDPETTPEELASLVATISRNSRHLLTVINDILDASKIEAGKLAVELVPCSLSVILGDVAEFFRPGANVKKIELCVDGPSNARDSIESDPARLRQILVNVVGNSMKFTEVGEIRLSAEFEAGQLIIDVSDTGIGIPSDKLEAVFDPFTQADNSTTRQFGGTGLGLSIARRLSEMLGGSLSMTSEVGRGTTTRIEICAGSAGDETGPVPKEDDSHDATTLDCRVLVAEDGPDNQRLIRMLLERAGADVKVVENGALACEEALRAKDSDRPYDVILMDMQMPVLDGYSATRRLRANNYSGPIAALTAHAMTGDRQRCLDCGCDEFLSKPIDRKKLIQLVHTMANSTLDRSVS